MTNCIYCDYYVIDDENAGMTDDGTYRMYHPECQQAEIVNIFESGKYAVMHREGKFASDKERWDAAVKECLRIHQQITLDDQNKNDIKIYCDETMMKKKAQCGTKWAAYVKRCLEGPKSLSKL